MSRSRQESAPLVLLVFVAGSDLFFRFGDEFLSLFFASVSLGIGAGVLTVSQWLVVVTALVVFAPRLYPPTFRELVETVPLRVIVAATGTGIAVVLSDVRGAEDAGWLFVVAITFMLALSVALRANDVSVFDEKSQVVAALDWFASQEGTARDELAKAKTYGGVLGVFALAIFAVAVYIVFFTPVFIAGLITVVLVETFPLPDVLVIVYVLGVIAATGVERLPAPPRALELDEYLLAFARQATNGIHSMFVSLLFGVGIFLTVATPLVGLRLSAELLSTAVRPPILPHLAWNVVGLVFLFLTAVGYGLWFWLRMVPRIGAFFERWNDDDRETPLASRPRSLLLPTFVATAVATAGFSNGFLGENRHVFAVVWPIPVVATGWVVWRTRRRHPTVARREDVAVVAAVLIAVFTLMGSLAILQNDLAPLLSPDVALLCGVILYVSGIGPVSRYGDRHDRRYGDADDERRFALPLYLANGSLLALLSTGYVAGTLEVLLLASGVLMLVFGGALGASKYYYL